jgi:2-oxo-4-hydroxy-4-carboxy-5-ureidoimidazoline decarboxylase
MQPDLDTLNRCNEEEFVRALAGVFEHSDWVARHAVKARPFGSVEQLHTALFDEVRRASKDVQKQFLCAHPELAGREAQQGALTANSENEQAGAGLLALSAAEMQRITALNAAYRTKHGFPYIVCVPLQTKASLLANFEQRLQHDSDAEMQEALAQIKLITKLRLERLLQAS